MTTSKMSAASVDVTRSGRLVPSAKWDRWCLIRDDVPPMVVAAELDDERGQVLRLSEEISIGCSHRLN